jgi:hypothetical protein
MSPVGWGNSHLESRVSGLRAKTHPCHEGMGAAEHGFFRDWTWAKVPVIDWGMLSGESSENAREQR